MIDNTKESIKFLKDTIIVYNGKFEINIKL